VHRIALKGGKRFRWRGVWKGPNGERCSQLFPDRRTADEVVAKREREAILIREGSMSPHERNWHESAKRPIADHIEDYRLSLLSKDDTPRHAAHIAYVLTALFKDASIGRCSELEPTRLQAAVGRIRVKRSPRTANHALGALKAFVRWLERSHRIKEAPAGILAIRPYNERVDRKRQRRALTPAEAERLLAATEAGLPFACRGPNKGPREVYEVSGRERAVLYRLALGTGFRAKELRSLTPEVFRIEGAAPTITVKAAYSKHRSEDVQPIAQTLAEILRPWLAGKVPGQPVFRIPWDLAEMLRADLAAAGIPVETSDGVLDFHALRHTFATGLVNRGVPIKTAQELMRHRTATLILDRYAHTDEAGKREALDGPAAPPRTTE
jgi:integrase